MCHKFKSHVIGAIKNTCQTKKKNFNQRANKNRTIKKLINKQNKTTATTTTTTKTRSNNNNDTQKKKQTNEETNTRTRLWLSAREFFYPISFPGKAPQTPNLQFSWTWMDVVAWKMMSNVIHSYITSIINFIHNLHLYCIIIKRKIRTHKDDR